jgi:hypothetical protein
MFNKNIFIFIIIVFGFVFYQSNVTAQEIAIVENFADPEIDSLQSYLNSMELQSKVFSKDLLTYDSVANYDLLIWDDLSYQSGGITDSNVSVFNQFYQSGKPIYFIGDDLAYSIINLSQQWATVWTNLLHLAGVNNFSQYYTVYIINSTHPVTNGLYGHVNDFDYSLDIDYATRTNTGELVLGTTTDSDVLLVYDGINARTVTQNCLVIQAGSDSSITERKKLFKNAVAWLLHNNIGIKKEQNLTAKEYSLSQNYPNPFNPKTIINFQLPKNNYVTLTIYDILGRKVSILVIEELKAGTYQVDWDASNYTSGVYFYKFIAGEFTETKKMILMK